MNWAKEAYISNKPPLVVEHAFPLTGFVGLLSNTTFGGSHGLMSTARPELPYQGPSWPRILGRSDFSLQEN